MAEGRSFDLVGDISVLIIDHDAASIASLTSMLGKFSTRVMSVDTASKALSMIEEHKDIGLIMLNTELPYKDSDYFLNALLHKDITLTLMYPVRRKHITSDLLTNKARFFLNKPISEIDMKDMWENVLPKSVMEEQKQQIEALRKSLKRQRASQASLLGKRRPVINTVTSPDSYQNRTVEWGNKQKCSIEIENKIKEHKPMENNVGRQCSVWTHERHTKFLATLSDLGEGNTRPSAILRLMNDPELTYSQVASHLQKYKAQTERVRDTSSRNKGKSTDKTYKNPSDYLRKNLTEINTLWDSLRNESSSSFMSQFNSFEKPDADREAEMPKLHLGGELDISNPSHSDDVLDKLFMDVNHVSSSKNPSYSIPSTHNADHIGLVSTGLGSENPPVYSGLVASVGPVQTESTRVSIPQFDPNQFQPPSSIPEIDWNQIDRDSAFFDDLPNLCNIEEDYNVLPNSNNSFEASIDQMKWVPSVENLEGNMNHIDRNPSIDNYVTPEAGKNIVVPETKIDPMGWASSEGYVPSGNMMGNHFDIGNIGHVSFGENILPLDGTNVTNVGFGSSEIPFQTYIPETNNQYHPVEGNVFPENMNNFGTKTSQIGLAPCDTSHAAVNNMVPFNTKMEETNHVALDNEVPLETMNEEGNQVPIEDLVYFDNDPNEIDVPWSLEEYESAGINNPLSTRSTSEQEDLIKCMNWIEEMMENEDA